MGRELPRWLTGKESACQCRRRKRQRFSPWVRKIPQKRKWQLTPVFLLGKSYGQRSLAGHSPQGHKESDMTKLLSMRSCARTHTHTHTHTQLWEEDHMVPLQCGGNLWPRVGAGVGLEVGRGTKKPKLATLGYKIQNLLWKVLFFPSAGPAPKHISKSIESHFLL